MNDQIEKGNIKPINNNIIYKSIIEELLKCDICNNLFDITIRKPLMSKCGHTFCKQCLIRNNNKICPLETTKKLKIKYELCIPNLKIESIVKKLININPLTQTSINQKQILHIKPEIKKNSNSKNSKKKVSNNINEINSCFKIKNINNNINNNNNNYNNNNNINININKINLYNHNENAKKNTENNNIIKNISSEINDNLNSPQIEEEIILNDDKFLFEDDNILINDTIETIPMNEEKSFENKSFKEDINELLLKNMLANHMTTNEEPNEELNLSSSNNLKKLNLVNNTNTDSLNTNTEKEINDIALQNQKMPNNFLNQPKFSLTQTNTNNNNQNQNLSGSNEATSSLNSNTNTLNNIKENVINEGKKNNETHQIITVYDKIKSE